MMDYSGKKIIAADIGGTYSRLAAFEVTSPRDLDLIASITLETGRFRGLDDLLDHCEESSFNRFLIQGDIIVIAVAGPVQSPDQSELTNIDWPINLKSAKTKYDKADFF